MWLLCNSILLVLVFGPASWAAALTKPTIDENGTISHTICDGQLAELNCNPGQVISIVIGNYGRFSNQVCIEDADNLVPLINNCQNHKTKAILEKKCNGKSTCDVEVSKKTFPDDPCPKTSKYLEVKHRCVVRATTTTTSTTTTTAAELMTAERVEEVVEAVDDGDQVRKELDLVRRAKHVCVTAKRKGVDWPATEAHKLARRACPEASTGTQTWECNARGEWATAEPNTTACESQWTSTRDAELNDAISTEDASGIPDILRQLASDTRRPMVGGDIPNLVTLLERIVAVVVEEPWTRNVQLMTNKGIAEVINYVIRSDDVWRNWPVSKQRHFSSRLLALADKAFIASSTQIRKSTLPNTSESNVIMQPSVTCEIGERIDLNTNTVDYFVFPSVAIWGDPTVDSVKIPREAIATAANGTAQVYFSSFANIGAQMQPYDLVVPAQDGLGTAIRRRRVVSRLVGANVISNGAAKHVQKLSKPVIVTFSHHESAVRHMDSPTCAWWNTRELDWSQAGCVLRAHNATTTVCECSHLTYFAVLMDVRGRELDDVHETMLSWITYIGCSVSIVCLLLAFLCFFVFSYGGGDRVFIHQNLCLTLAAAEIAFLLGIWRTETIAECSLVAATLMYLFLSALTWMLLEGYHIYRMLIEVFPTGSKKGWFVLIGYGFPAIVTIGAYVFDPSGFGTSRHCWLRTDNFFIMFFVGPAAVILLANTAMLVKTMCVVYQHANGGYLPCRHESDVGRNIRTWVKGAMGLVCLLGITWTCGLLWIDDGHSIVMAYAFTIANSLQGVFIFVFHVIFSEKMRKDMRRWMGKRGCCTSSDSPQKRFSLPRDVLSPVNGSATGSEFLYPVRDKYQCTRSLDTTSQFGYNTRIHSAIYEPQQGTYDYATIAYGDMLPGHVQRAPPSYHRIPPAHLIDARYGINGNCNTYGGWHHRPPPEFSPPPPPTTAVPRPVAYASNTNSSGTTTTSSSRRPPSSKMSEDSAYSDGSSMLTTEVTPQGHTVLRIDLNKSSQMYCHEL